MTSHYFFGKSLQVIL